MRVHEVMTTEVTTTTPGTLLKEAAQELVRRRVSGMPVVEDGRVVGIVTGHDLVAALTEALRAHVTTVRPIAAPPAGVEPEE